MLTYMNMSYTGLRELRMNKEGGDYNRKRWVCRTKPWYTRKLCWIAIYQPSGI